MSVNLIIFEGPRPQSRTRLSCKNRYLWRQLRLWLILLHNLSPKNMFSVERGNKTKHEDPLVSLRVSTSKDLT